MAAVKIVFVYHGSDINYVNDVSCLKCYGSIFFPCEILLRNSEFKDQLRIALVKRKTRIILSSSLNLEFLNSLAKDKEMLVKWLPGPFAMCDDDTTKGHCARVP